MKIIVEGTTAVQRRRNGGLEQRKDGEIDVCEVYFGG